MLNKLEQNLLLSNDTFIAQEEYWLNKLAGDLVFTRIIPDFRHIQAEPAVSKQTPIIFSGPIWERISLITKQADVSIYILLLTALKTLVYYYTGASDITVGSPVYRENRTEVTFNELVPMRVQLHGQLSFKEFLLEVRKTVLEAYDNQDFPLPKILEELRVPPKNRFGLICLLENIHDSKENNGDLVFSFQRHENGLTGTISYNPVLYLADTAGRLAQHFIRLLEGALEDVNHQLTGLEFLSLEEKTQLLVEFNRTASEYPKDRTVPELFSEQAFRHSAKMAVRYRERQLTYRELDQISTRLARLLIRKGVTAGGIVGIMTERSPEMVIGILGILKAGGAYLPVDSKYPDERIKYMLENSETKLLLTQRHLLNKAQTAKVGGVEVIDLNDESQYPPGTDWRNSIQPNDLAYVMYTSGSTGKPKGVMVEHQNIVRLVKNTNYIEFKEDDRILQTGAIVFDASTFEIWGALLNGLSLYLVDEEVILDPEKMEEALVNYGITILWLTSPLFNQLSRQRPEMFRTLSYLLVGGDVLSPNHINLVRNQHPRLKIINGYGPTENTTFSTCFLIREDYEDNIPIGKPIGNSTAYIVDQANHLKPIGAVGELCVGGDGVARGYFKQPELTAAKFIADCQLSTKRIYRTGDLARWLPDGNIDFIGRVDNQVKIRGFRIEIQEIENLLQSHPQVKNAVVIAREDELGRKYLCAYFVSDQELEISRLRESLLRELPDYMVPSYFIQVASLPLTVNGKIDKNALPEPEGLIVTGTPYVAPQGDKEQKLADIWREILNVEKIGINDNFFELGGHSLNATIMAARIAKEFNIKIPLTEVFRTPTIGELAGYLDSGERDYFCAIRPAAAQEYYPLSSAQKRLFYIEQLEGLGTSYNVPVVLTMDGDLDRQRFEQVFQKLVSGMSHSGLPSSWSMGNRSKRFGPRSTLKSTTWISAGYRNRNGSPRLRPKSTILSGGLIWNKPRYSVVSCSGYQIRSISSCWTCTILYPTVPHLASWPGRLSIYTTEGNCRIYGFNTRIFPCGKMRCSTPAPSKNRKNTG